jgi:hypothetical protein
MYTNRYTNPLRTAANSEQYFLQKSGLFTGVFEQP